MFHVGSAHSDDNDSDFESEPIEVKYDLLLDAFQEIHAKSMRLQSKVNRLSSERKDYEYQIDNLVEENDNLKKELETALQSVKTIKTEIKIVEKNCENCPIHQEKID